MTQPAVPPAVLGTRRPDRRIAVLLAIALATTGLLVGFVWLTKPPGPTIARGLPVPEFSGRTPDNSPLDRAGPVVEVTVLGKHYGGRRVGDDVSFRVDAGEIVALLGPNGAGKTTTVEIVEGYRRPDAGSVSVLGVDPRRAGREVRARVGLMLQGGGGIDPRMTACEVVLRHGRFHARPREPDETLRLVGLPDAAARTRYRRLSGGERQRIGLALALVAAPDLAILDEPTAGMA